MEYGKVGNMFAPTNPEREEMRAQAILRSFTEYREAVDLFAPQGETAECAAPANRNNGQSITRFFKAIKLNRRPMVDEPVQQSAYSPRQVTTSDCSR
jgi:hypothetical protein